MEKVRVKVEQRDGHTVRIYQAEVDGVLGDPFPHTEEPSHMFECACVVEDAPALLEELRAADEILSALPTDPRPPDMVNRQKRLLIKAERAKDDIETLPARLEDALRKSRAGARNKALRSARARAGIAATIAKLDAEEPVEE